MSITTTTHLNFDGTARKALEFYQSVFGGSVVVSTYGAFGMPADLPDADKVVFGQLEAENGFRVMAYDVPGGADGDSPEASDATHRENGMTFTDRPFFLSVRGETLDEVSQYWTRLAVGATVIEALAASAWAPGFGMLQDRFGVVWVLDVSTDQG